MLGRFKRVALAATALGVVALSSAAQAATLYWDPGSQSDLSLTRESCIGPVCVGTNWKRVSGIFGVATQFDSDSKLIFGDTSWGTSSGTATNTVDNLLIAHIEFADTAGEFTLNGDKAFLGRQGLTNLSDSEQNINFDVRIYLDQTWSTNGGAFDINGDVDINGNPDTTFTNETSTLTITGSGATNIDGAITGAADATIIKNGNGTLSLDGNNSGFLGDIDLNNGRLRLDGGDNISAATNIDMSGDAVLDLNGTGEDIGGLSGGGSVDLSSSASLRVGLNDEDTSYGGTIFGSGSLTKGGDGTLSLFGASTYSGGTTVDGGTLKGSTISLQDDITNNANLEFNQQTLAPVFDPVTGLPAVVFVPFGGTYAGNLSGTGTVNFTGGGTVTLAGSNGNASGDFIVTENSTLRMGAGNAVGSSTVSLNNGTLDLNGTGEDIGGLAGSNGQVDLSDNATLRIGFNDTDTAFTGTIFGNGALVKQGLGTTTLIGTNTYTGGTTVESGTLAGDTSSLQGDISTSGRVQFDQNTDGTYAGMISGDGFVTKSGGGTVTFTGNNTYTGGAAIQAGKLRGTTDSLTGGLRLFDGSTGSGAGVEIDQDFNGNVTGLISGDGSLTKNGSGTVTLMTHTAHTGATVINNGQLSINGNGNGHIDHSSSLTVGENGIFNGSRYKPGRNFPRDVPSEHGYSYGGQVNNQGVIRGGNGVTSGTGTGALTLTGNVSGAGSFEGVVAINGTFRPGNSPALITAETLSFGASNALFMEIGGYGRGSEFDAINATTLSLNGLLDIALLDLNNGFVPMAGDTFDLLIADQIFGEFSSFSFAALTGGLFWSTQLISNQLGMVYQLVVNSSVVGGVPGPGAIFLLLVGLAGVGVMRQRKS